MSLHLTPELVDRRILHVPRRFVVEEWGGTEAVLAGLLPEQIKAGWQPEIHTSLALSRSRREQFAGCPVHRYSYLYPVWGLSAEDRLRLDKKGGNLLSLPLLQALLTVPQVRLYHAHTLNRVGGAVLTAARCRRKPCVVTLHGGVYDLPPAEREHLIAPVRDKFDWGRPAGWLLRSHRLLQEADAVICLGAGEYEGARQHLGHDRIYLLGNGVEPERFAGREGSRIRNRLGIPPEAVVAGVIGRLDPQKDQLRVLLAFERVAAELPQLHLIVAGPCTVADYAEKIRCQREASAYRDRIHLLPPLNAQTEELAEAYQAMDFLVLASRHEPFGIVVLEAWSASRPVVVSAVGGLRSLVREGETGWFFPPGEEEALAGRLRWMVEHPQERREMGEAGAREVRQRYTWAQIQRELEVVYQRAEAWVSRRR